MSSKVSAERQQELIDAYVARYLKNGEAVMALAKEAGVGLHEFYKWIGAYRKKTIAQANRAKLAGGALRAQALYLAAAEGAV